MDGDSTFEERVGGSPDEARRFGVGFLPRDLERLNWNAMLWGGLWTLVYGVWPWLGLFVAVHVVTTVMFVWVGRSELLSGSVSAVVITYAFTTLLSWILPVYFGFVANRVLWERRASRPVAGKAPTVEAFLRTQHKWALLGLVWIAFGWAQAALALRTPSMLTAPALISSAVMTVVILAGVWLWSRVRAVHLTSASSGRRKR